LKSRLYIELTQRQQTIYERSDTEYNQLMAARVIGTPRKIQPKGLSDLEVIQKQIVYYYDNHMFY